jgi:hypothetical protein
MDVLVKDKVQIYKMNLKWGGGVVGKQAGSDTLNKQLEKNK